MITELGHYSLILALAVAIVQATVPLVGAARDDGRLMHLGRVAADRKSTRLNSSH